MAARKLSKDTSLSNLKQLTRNIANSRMTPAERRLALSPSQPNLNQQNTENHLLEGLKPLQGSIRLLN